MPVEIKFYTYGPITGRDEGHAFRIVSDEIQDLGIMSRDQAAAMARDTSTDFNEINILAQARVRATREGKEFPVDATPITSDIRKKKNKPSK